MKGIFQTHFLSRKKQRLFSSLKRVPVFKGLTKKQIKRLSQKGYVRYYKDGEHVFHKNEPAYGFFAVLRGRVDIIDGKKHFITYTTHDSFGEFSLLQEATRAADAVTHGDTILCYFFKETLTTLFLSDPKLCMTLYQNLLEAAIETLRKG